MGVTRLALGCGRSIRLQRLDFADNFRG